MALQQHFLVVTVAAQGHVNPALNLCRRLVRTGGEAARVTLSTTFWGHRRLFPGSADDEEVHDGLIYYVGFSDGYDNGYKDVDDRWDYYSRTRSIGSEKLAAVLRTFEERGRPVTCLIYNMLMPWAGDLAREHCIPSAAYWIQPATVFAIYYHYFHGYDGLIAAHSQDPLFAVDLPGLPPFKLRDLPSFLRITSSDDPYAVVLRMFKDMFDVLDREEAAGATAMVLVNTFDELEADALVAAGKVKLIPIGPMVPPALLKGTRDANVIVGGGGADLFKPDEKRYMEWLDIKPEKSVVYVSFGSLTTVKQQQAGEILRGLKATGRPYLWVVRKDNQAELEAGGMKLEAEEGEMVVEWCSQLAVLSHPAVGCFVTHCGWNSTMEALACGVPTVAVPQWTDQATNARLMEVWGTGVRAELEAEGVVEAAELRRCVETVMAGGERAEEIGRRAEAWKDKAREAVGEGGSSDRNLRAFVEEMARAS